MCSEDFYGFCLAITLMSIVAFIGYVIHTDEYSVIKRETCVEYSSQNGECVSKVYDYSCKIDNGNDVFRNKNIDKVNEFCEKKRSKK